MRIHSIIILFLITCWGCYNGLAQQPHAIPGLIQVETPTDASLRGLHALSETVVWASGTKGTFLRTTNKGQTWTHGSIVDTVDFRDIYAFDENRAVVVSAGHPALIFKTTNGGNSWDLVYKNHDKRIFFDAIDFWDNDRGIAFSDAFDGKFFLLITKNGGETWSQLQTSPEALEGEGGFAASGTNMILTGSGEILIGTTAGRLLQSNDMGMSWTWIQSLLESSKSTSGIFSIAARDGKAIMVGGDFTAENHVIKNAAYMEVSGKWFPCNENPPRGYRSCVAFVPETSIAICTGPGGTDISFDSGRNWQILSGDGYHSVSFGNDINSGWMSGSSGRMAKIKWQ